MYKNLFTFYFRNGKRRDLQRTNSIYLKMGLGNLK